MKDRELNQIENAYLASMIAAYQNPKQGLLPEMAIVKAWLKTTNLIDKEMLSLIDETAKKIKL